MFRHKGKSRTYAHNIRLASLLSFVAGLVNITGVLLVRVLTTNVTGHFAYFSEELSGAHYRMAAMYLFFIGAFLVGAFTSNLLIEIVSRVKAQVAYVFPIVMEMLILCAVALYGSGPMEARSDAQLTAGVLLFAMGLQNALVTKVSQSVVRTTHLTGLFTDLGIELSQLFFYRKDPGFQALVKSIYLKLSIISCFFAGCLTGGLVFSKTEAKTLLIAAVFLGIALCYDNIRFRYYYLKRKTKYR